MMIRSIKTLIKTILAHNSFGLLILRRHYDRMILAEKSARSAALGKYGMSILREVHEKMTRAGLKYWADFGTLLGLIRDGGPIKHDDDIDISIPPEVSLKEILMAIESEEYVLDHGFTYNGMLTEITFVRHGVPVDFFRTDCDENSLLEYLPVADLNAAHSAYDRVMYYRIYRRPPMKIEEGSFGDLRIMIPCDPENVCEFIYGKEWRCPNPYHQHSIDDDEKVYMDDRDCTVERVDAEQCRKLLCG